jgi:putative FmdB family regulatory protein
LRDERPSKNTQDPRDMTAVRTLARARTSRPKLDLWEGKMPIYEYVCQKCHHAFEVLLTFKEHDQEEVRCPRCKSKNVEQDVAEFFAATSRKS